MAVAPDPGKPWQTLPPLRLQRPLTAVRPLGQTWLSPKFLVPVGARPLHSTPPAPGVDHLAFFPTLQTKAILHARGLANAPQALIQTQILPDQESKSLGYARSTTNAVAPSDLSPAHHSSAPTYQLPTSTPTPSSPRSNADPQPTAQTSSSSAAPSIQRAQSQAPIQAEPHQSLTGSGPVASATLAQSSPASPPIIQRHETTESAALSLHQRYPLAELPSLQGNSSSKAPAQSASVPVTQLLPSAEFHPAGVDTAPVVTSSPSINTSESVALPNVQRFVDIDPASAVPSAPGVDLQHSIVPRGGEFNRLGSPHDAAVAIPPAAPLAELPAPAESAISPTVQRQGMLPESAESRPALLQTKLAQGIEGQEIQPQVGQPPVVQAQVSQAHIAQSSSVPSETIQSPAIQAQVMQAESGSPQAIQSPLVQHQIEQPSTAQAAMGQASVERSQPAAKAMPTPAIQPKTLDSAAAPSQLGEPQSRQPQAVPEPGSSESEGRSPSPQSVHPPAIQTKSVEPHAITPAGNHSAKSGQIPTILPQTDQLLSQQQSGLSSQAEASQAQETLPQAVELPSIQTQAVSPQALRPAQEQQIAISVNQPPVSAQAQAQETPSSSALQWSAGLQPSRSVIQTKAALPHMAQPSVGQRPLTELTPLQPQAIQFKAAPTSVARASEISPQTTQSQAVQSPALQPSTFQSPAVKVSAVDPQNLSQAFQSPSESLQTPSDTLEPGLVTQTPQMPALPAPTVTSPLVQRSTATELSGTSPSIAPIANSVSIPAPRPSPFTPDRALSALPTLPGVVPQVQRLQGEPPAAAQSHENAVAIPPEGRANAPHSQPSTISLPSSTSPLPPVISPEQPPTIQRQIVSPSLPTSATVPATWSSLADLITQSTPAPSLPRPLPPSPPPAHSSTPPTLQPLRNPEPPAPSPTEPANPPSETLTAPTSEDTDQNVDALEDLAQEIYGLIKTRLAIERERWGGYSGRLPW